MDWINYVLGPFVRLRAQLADVGTPGDIFVLSLVAYSALLVFVAVVAHELSREAASLTMWCAQRLVRGSALRDVVRLESSSARIASLLNWLGTRIVRSSYGMPDQEEYIPREGRELAVVRALRWLLRTLWLLLRGLLVFLSALPRLLSTTLGISVLLLAACTAFPDVIRDAVIAVEFFVTGVSVSEASAITVVTVGAAVVTVAVVIAKVVVSEPVTARRSFRRRRNEAAIEQLHRAETAIATLESVVRNEMYEMVRTFEVEKYYAQQWFDWAQQSSQGLDRRRVRSEKHLKCSRECLEYRLGPKAFPAYNSNLQTAVSEIEAVWNEGLSEHMWILTRLVTRQARQGLLGLYQCFLESGEFRMSKLPCLEEWQLRRVKWQHGQLAWGNPTDADIAAGRTVIIRTGTAPEMRWLEEDLLKVVWDLAELCRELGGLADYAYELSNPGRFERIIRATE